jgi:HAE1 family hydrophobic/amphiphilic exporter-1
MQKLAEICVHRPVFATMLVLSLVVAGAFSFFSLGVDRFPNVDMPVVTVITFNPGASPQEIETEVTDVIEGAVNTVSGLDELRSISVEGLSTVVAVFDLEKDVDIAVQEVRQKVDLVLRDLPTTADLPIVQKVDLEALPIMFYAVSANRPVVELTELVDREVKERLQTVNGVGEVTIYGGRKRQVRIQLYPERLRAYSLSVLEVAQALRAQNLELPGGKIDQGEREVMVRTAGRVTRPEDFNEVVIRTWGGYPITLRDVGYAVDGGATPDSAAALDGVTAVAVAVRKQSGANTVAVAEAVEAKMAEIQKLLPEDVRITLSYDQSEFIKASLAAIEEHLVLGGLFAALVVFVFLLNFRSTLIAAISIPTSIISAFALMAALGYTLNQMTMLALTLMVGIVIDDAIIVLENIYRFVEEKGLRPFEAAIEATREIGLAVLATTLSLLAVFVPIGFMGGIVGRFMSSFGLTASAAIAVSLIVAFTLTPMLCSRWIRARDNGERTGETSKESRFYRPIDSTYTRMLEWAMAHRKTIVIASVLVSFSTVPLFLLAGINFIPDEDESQFEVTLRAPEGTSLAATQSVLERIARDLREGLPGVRHTMAVAGFGAQRQPNEGTIFVKLWPAHEREFSQAELISRARSLLAAYPREFVISVQPPSPLRIAGTRNAAIQYVLSGPDLEKLDEYSRRLLEHMRNDPNMVDVDRSLIPGKPEVRVEIDRRRAADLGVRVADIAQTLNLLIAGDEVTTYNEGTRQYDVVVQAEERFRRDPSALMEMTVPSATGAPVLLANVVNLKHTTGPAVIDRLNRQRQVTLFANLAPGGAENEALASIGRFVAEMRLEPGYTSAVSGRSKELGRAGYYFGLAFALSFIFMYIVLAAQFESFLHPITILLTLPMAVPFALLSTFLAGQKLNIFSALGVLLLFGIVKKNAILQIAHTNELRSQGLERYEAIILANRHRLRPILMTTLALVAGMTPLALGSGPGAATNRSIALLVIGGQSLCLLLTLLAVPVFYSLFDDLVRLPWWASLAARARAAEERAGRRLALAGNGLLNGVWRKR